MRAGDAVGAAEAREHAIAAYCNLRDCGEHASPGEAFAVSLLSWGLMTRKLEPDDLAKISEQEIFRAFLGGPAFRGLLAALDGTGTWTEFYNALSTPGAVARGDNKSLTDRLMRIERRIAALEQQGHDTNERVQAIDRAARDLLAMFEALLKALTSDNTGRAA